jgi:DNA-binding response OmpR family regulator
VQAAAPQVVLLDWELLGLSAAILWERRSLCPSVRLVAMSGLSEARLAALNAGADAFVGKGEPPEGLLAALEGVSKG